GAYHRGAGGSPGGGPDPGTGADHPGDRDQQHSALRSHRAIHRYRHRGWRVHPARCGRRQRRGIRGAGQRPARDRRAGGRARRTGGLRWHRRFPGECTARHPTGRASMIRVLLVDDQTLVRQGVRSLLEVADDIEVIAEADDGMAALVALDDADPDVVLLDLRMPRHDGLWTLRAMRERGIDVPVLVLTTFDDDELVLAALRAGARGYLLKDVTLEQLTTAVCTLA